MTRTASLVVATRDRPQALAALLQTAASLQPAPDETIVVDNTAGDPSTRAAAEAAGAIYLTAPVTGLSGARNAGARRAAGDVVAFIDDDAVPVADWLRHLSEPFADPRVMATTGRIVGQADLDLGSEPRVLDAGTEHWFEICNFGGIGHGGNLAVRRSAFDSWPGFHESLGLGTPIPGNEEHHAFYELVRAGHRVAYAPAAVVSHPAPDSSEALRAQQLRWLRGFAGYVALLLVEQPAARRPVLRYLAEAARGTPRTWRTSDTQVLRLVSRPAMARALLGGPLAYARSRRRHRRYRPTPP